MTNSQTDPNQELNQLSEEELEKVAGGGLLDSVGDKVKDFVDDAREGAEIIIDAFK